MDQSRKQTQYLANLGEVYVILRLAENNLYSTRVRGCNFDVLCENGKRIEVKSARKRLGKWIRKTPTKTYVNEYEWYHFNLLPKMLSSYRHGRKYYVGYEKKPIYCDYFVLVPFDEKNKPVCFYVVPSQKLSDKLAVRIPADNSYKNSWVDYTDKWDQIVA